MTLHAAFDIGILIEQSALKRKEIEALQKAHFINIAQLKFWQ